MAASRTTVPEIAAGMLKRYSSPKIALEMAHFHSMDYPVGSSRYNRWRDVRREIMCQAHVDMDGRPLPRSRS